MASPSSLARLRLGAFVILLAIPGAGCLAQQWDPQRIVMAENAEISARIADATQELERARAELARLHKTQEDLDARMQQIDNFAKLPGLGREFVQTVLEELRTLPKPALLTARLAEGQALVATSDSYLRAERALRELEDIDAVAAQRLKPPASAAPQAPTVEPALRQLLGEQRTLLSRLVADQQQLLRLLREIRDAEQALDQRNEAARGELTGLLFWIPVRPGKETITELGQALAWTVSAANWGAVAGTLRSQIARKPLWPTAALLLAVGLYAARKRLWEKLAALAPSEIGYERYRIGHAMAALALTLGLALPLPIVMHTAAAAAVRIRHPGIPGCARRHPAARRRAGPGSRRNGLPAGPTRLGGSLLRVG